MKIEKISVVIPVYNSEKFIAETLDSVISQTYQNLEIICINDGSQDESILVLKRYVKKDNRIKIIDQKNSGVVSARNTGISAANGKYILPLDSDDILSNNAIEKLHSLIKKNRCAVAAPSVRYFGDRNNKFILPKPTAKNMALRNCIVNCALFEKKYWEKYGGYDSRFNKGLEDYDFWWNFLQDRKKIIRTKEVLFYYRYRYGLNSRNQQTANYHQHMIDIMLSKYPLMKKLNKPKIKSYLMQKIQHPINTIKTITFKPFRVARLLRWRKYGNFVLNNQLDKSKFVEITSSPYMGDYKKKLIAYYLPQYYQIPQNDKWFGAGFTEWYNTSKAVPQFDGHWQPHIPIDVGYYNLESTRVMHRQIELAKMYGIYGFCFYYYWFSGGEKIMEKPIDNWIKDKNINFPFMLFWANEDWTNTWGEEADLGTKTYSAKTNPEDVKKFVKDIMPFIKKPNYITIDGRPHIIIYQALKDPYLPEFIKGISDLIQIKGVKKPYISLVFPDHKPDKFDPRKFNADAAVEFGVHMKIRPDYIQKPISKNKIVNHLARITEYDMKEFIDNDKFIYKTDFMVHKGVMTSFDNTARKVYSGAHLFRLTPYLYKKWLKSILQKSKSEYIFLSAWNEWAEGMHLEPDHKYGYAYLQATKEALENMK